MALSEQQKSNSISIIRLMQMTTVPTSEELHYILGIAKKNQKPVELPFKNPYNNITFMVRVAPGTTQKAPRWTFERCDYDRNVHLWVRESNEVIMIQGKIKIECNYSGDGGIEPEVSEEDLESFRTTGSQAIIMGSPSNSQSNLKPLLDNIEQTQEDLRAERKECQLSTSGTWLFNHGDSGPVMMPPPVALNETVVDNYMTALSNPATGFLRHTAFEFFLLRDLAYVQKSGGKLSLVIFDFIDPATGEKTDVTDLLPHILTDSLGDLFSPLELFTQLRTGEYAVLLCGYDGAAALDYAKTLRTRLINSAPVDCVCANEYSVSMGVACIPETTSNPGVLIAAAIKAKNMARDANRGAMLFPLF